MDRYLAPFRAFLCIPLLIGMILTWGCAPGDAGSPVLRADMPLHLEEHLDQAVIHGSEAPADPPTAVEWIFEDGPGDWKPVLPFDGESGPPTAEGVEDGLRVQLTESTGFSRGDGPRRYRGAIYVDLPDWNREEWAYVVIRARTSDDIGAITVAYNLRAPGDTARRRGSFQHSGEYIDLISDGTIHSYIMRADWSWGNPLDGPWKQLGVSVGSSDEPASIDILSISVIPKAAKYANAPMGVSNEVRGGKYHRRVLFGHAPGRVEYRVRVPQDGRLDTGLGVLREDIPVTFRVRVDDGRSEPHTVLEETIADDESWHDQSVDLSEWSGQTVSLALEAEADDPGTVALWAAPTVSGYRATDKPNIVFYIIDAGGADYMSVYGYNRKTTPVMEHLASEGALFEHAYSNSSWSKTSTPSFATSLHHSVLGGYKTDTDPIPEQAVTMAEHLHAAGYQTAVITSNAYAGTMSSLDRGTDFLRDQGAEPNSTSTLELHGDYWNWRDASPGEPWFVHFQTTDVHWPWKPVAPFAGTFIEPERRQQFYDWEESLAAAAGEIRPRWLSPDRYSEDVYNEAGVDRVALFDAARALYDECLASQDRELGRLVERLKAQGEWEHTLLIVAADHGNAHGLGLLDSLPERPYPNLRSYITRIPMIIVWPESIPGGQRFTQPVSMIDMLPTILDLAGLPLPNIMQGRTLAPLLLGEVSEAEWEPRPVIFDEFYVDWDDGQLSGSIEMIDGRWGAALMIEPEGEEEDADAEEATEAEVAEGEEDVEDAEEESPRLLLYDLWDDPHALTSVHEQHPDLVQAYTARLEDLWAAHQALAQRFTSAGEVPLTAEQVETLRSLGYIQ